MVVLCLMYLLTLQNMAAEPIESFINKIFLPHSILTGEPNKVTDWTAPALQGLAIFPGQIILLFQNTNFSLTHLHPKQPFS